MLAQMFTIAGGIGLVLFILVCGETIAIIGLVAVAVIASTFFIGSFFKPGNGITVTIWIFVIYFVANTIYKCYLEFMREWRK